MEELVQDLVSALEQTSEQAKLDELWEEMVLSPLQQRRQVRRRRGRKRRCDFALHPPEHGRCLSEASESSLDGETGVGVVKEHREGATVAIATAAIVATNYSDSDDTPAARRCPAAASFRARQHSWPESDSFTENTPGRPLRRRRKVKRMTTDVTVSLQQKLKVSGMERGEHAHHHHYHHHHHHHHHHQQRSTKKQRFSRLKKRVGGWVSEGGGSAAGGAGVRMEECWKDRILRQAKEQREASDENMSECESSSVCSSDPGLFTNDEGRQGDDEQSDWVFEGECGSGIGAQSLLPARDPDIPTRPGGAQSGQEKHPSPTFLQPARPGQRGYHARLNRLPGVAARCFRKGRRRLLGKDNSMTVSMERMRHYSQDPYQKEFWLPSIGKRDRSQFNPLCPLPVYPISLATDNSHHRCSSITCKNRQTSVPMGLLCAGDIKRRRKTTAVPSSVSAYFPLRKEDAAEEATQGCSKTPPPEGERAISSPLTSERRDFTKPGTSSGHRRRDEEQEEN